VRFQWLAVAGLAGGCIAASPAAGFAIYGPTEDIAEAARWTSSSGLADGIRVGVEDSFLAAWSPTTADAAVVQSWVQNAFDAWENPALQFDVHFGDLDGAEIVLQALPGEDPLGGYFGIANVSFGYDANRELTNGQMVPGWTIDLAYVDIASDRVQFTPGFLTTGIRFQGRLITRLLMHEIGHTLGLGHPNFELAFNYDTDFDPTNAMVIDPAAPFADLVFSDNRFMGAIMANSPCGEGNPICAALVQTTLTFDDAGGRDALYPVLVPEPALGALLLIALAGVSRGRARRSAPARNS
jgi:hypothetical protein